MYHDKNAVHALNSYIWKLLQVNLEWTTDDYDGAVPLIPLAQQPELKGFNKPFIVYGSARHPSEHLYALIKEAVTYTIYATTVKEVDKVANLLAETFSRQDEAAIDVSDWLTEEAEVRTGGHRGVHFATIRTIMAEKTEPAKEEGGFHAGMVMVETKYTQATSNIVTSGFTVD